MVSMTIAQNGSRMELVTIKVVKGNELTDIKMETFDGGDFPATTYQTPVLVTSATVATVKPLNLGLYDKVNAQRMSHQLAVLGARGDYFEIIADGVLVGTSTSATDLRNAAIEVLDYSGVPVAVQHAIFGKYSPFVTPTQPVTKGMIQGIDRQKIMAAYNVVAAADLTYLNQKVRGTATSRIQHKLTDFTGGSAADATVQTLKLKPEGDGVFVLPMNGVIWYGYGPDSTMTYTDAS